MHGYRWFGTVTVATTKMIRVQSHWVVSARNNVMPKCIRIIAPKSVGDRFDGLGPMDLKFWFSTDELVEASHEKAGIVGDMIGMQMSKKQMFNLARRNIHLVHLICGCWAAVDHHPLGPNPQ